MDGDIVDLAAVGRPTHADTRVLLADDDAVARLLTAAALAQRGWQVIEADGGVAALAAFAQRRPDVVVLDALMPGLDGFAACERLRRLPGGEHVPVLMLTGLDDEESIARAYEAGATDFFVKNTQHWTLLSQRLRYLLRNARMREELAASERRLANAQRIARLGCWEWDVERHWVRLSDECFAIAGLPRQSEGLADAVIWARVSKEERPRIEASFTVALHGAGHLDLECGILQSPGRVRTVRVVAEIDRDSAGAPRRVNGIVQDITDRRRTEERLFQLANFDTLTGLPNRRHFRELLAAVIGGAPGRGRAAAVLAVGLDRFKHLCDTLGQDVGDAVLREVARRLAGALRETDTVARVIGSEARHGGRRDKGMQAVADRLARLGDDQFAVLLKDVADVAAVERVAVRLLQRLRLPIARGGQQLYVTASIGVALCPQHGTDAEDLQRKADLAMQSVRSVDGDGWRVFDEAMDATAASRWRLEAALHRALERRELVLHYQPQVDVIGRRIVGAEALMRWKRGDELVAPDAFIGLAEETGLIVPMTEWAIDEVCAQIAAWRQAGVAVPVVSINISARNVQRGELVAVLKRAMQRYGLPAGSIGLELTETVLMHNLVTALPVLQELKQLGLSIAIDDFGTGYSSLAYLRRLPIDTLKIDRSFVGELESDPDDTAIVEAMIALAQSLELVVVAEGVETPGQAKQLLERGCARMQGWLFARALPAEEFVALLREGGRRMAWPDAAARAPDGHGKRSASRTCVRSAVCVIADGADGGCACAAQR